MNAPAQQQNQAMTRANNARQMADWLQSEQGQKKVQALAPGNVPVDKIRRTALFLMKDDDGDLAEATKESLANAIVQAFHMDLDLTTGEAYIIVYGNEAELRPGYKGLVKLAKQSEAVDHLFADIVREGDDFHYKIGLDGVELSHEPEPFGDGDIVGAYCVIKYANGEAEIERMSAADIQTVRSKASQYSGAWQDFWGEMAKKSVTRRALKWVDLSPEGRKAVAQDRRLDNYDAEQVYDGNEQIVSADQSVAALEQQFTPDASDDGDEAGDWALADMRALGEDADKAVQILVTEWGESDARRVVEDMALRRQCDPAALSDEDFGELYEEYLCSDSGMNQLEMKAL